MAGTTPGGISEMFSRARVNSFSKTPSEDVPAARAEGEWAPGVQGYLQRWDQYPRPVYASAASETEIHSAFEGVCNGIHSSLVPPTSGREDISIFRIAGTCLEEPASSSLSAPISHELGQGTMAAEGPNPHPENAKHRHHNLRKLQ